MQVSVGLGGKYTSAAQRTTTQIRHSIWSPGLVPELTRSEDIKRNKRVPFRVAGTPPFLDRMGEKPTRISDDSPSFADLYRMYNELLRLRSEVQADESRALKAAASDRTGTESDRP